MTTNKTTVSYRVNVIADRFGFSRTIPAIDYAGADNKADVMKSAKAFKKAGFEVVITEVTTTFKTLKLTA